ncbi:replication initiation protein [Mycobacterium phage MKC-IRE-01]
MRIRSIKPEFWRSQDVSAFEDWGIRLLFIGLWSYVDDNGVGLDRVALIAADLFADDLERDPSETFAKVSRGLQQLAEANRIVRYEFDGKSYLFVNGWGKHQRIDHPNEPRYPLPDGTIAHPARENTRSVRGSAKSSRKPRETVAPGTGEQGNKGTEDSSPLTLVEGGVGGDPQNLPVAHSAPAAPAAKASRGSRLPEGWMPDDETIAAMRQQFPHVDLRAEHEKFTDYWRGAAGAKGRKADWTATWRNWIRRAAENAPRTSASAPAASNGLGKPSQKALGWEKAGEALIAELEGRR